MTERSPSYRSPSPSEPGASGAEGSTQGGPLLLASGARASAACPCLAPQPVSRATPNSGAARELLCAEALIAPVQDCHVLRAGFRCTARLVAFRRVGTEVGGVLGVEARLDLIEADLGLPRDGSVDSSDRRPFEKPIGEACSSRSATLKCGASHTRRRLTLVGGGARQFGSDGRTPPVA